MKQVLLPLMRIGIFTFACLHVTSKIANAQVTADDTVNTQVNQTDNVSEITGGETRGDNLFHSFQEFSVGAGNEAFFNNAEAIANIFSRVTGGKVSTIDGLIRANGSANLFLINPAGITFGKGASLNIGGSFYGSSADSILFEDGEFSATDLDNPPVLTINAPIGLGFRDNPGDIINRSIASDPANNIPPDPANNIPVGLQVQPGKNISFIGGDVRFEGGFIFAPGGRVELGGLSAAGTISFNDDGSFSFPEGINRGNVSLTQASVINVTSGGGGFVTVNANDLEILDGSAILAGIDTGLGTPESQAGDITLNTFGKLSLQGTANTKTSQIANVVNTNGRGNAGNVIINTATLEGIGNFVIGSSTFGQGNAGKVTVTASENISFEGLEGFNSGIESSVAPSVIGNGNDINVTTNSLTLANNVRIFSGVSQDALGSGGTITTTTDNLSLSDSSNITTATSGRASNDIRSDAGDINVNVTNSFELTEGSFLQSDTFGQGDAGDITIEGETANIALDGVSANNILSSQISSSVASDQELNLVGRGSGGNIDIKAQSLLLTNGAQIGASTFGEGDAGTITINTSETRNASEQISQISIDGVGKNNDSSGIFSNVQPGAIGNANTITLNTANLFLSNGGAISSSTFGRESNDTRSDAGDINVNVTNSFELTEGSSLQSNTFTQGDAGDITIEGETANIALDGVNANNFSSQISTSVGFDQQQNLVGRGAGGNIDIKAQSLLLTNGAQIGASTFGVGDAGTITINTSETRNAPDQISQISIDGVGKNNFSSGIFSNVQPGAIGNANTITLNTANLFLSNGGAISSSTFGQGNAGNVKIDATDTVSLSGFFMSEDDSGFASQSQIATIVGSIPEEQVTGVGLGGNIKITARNLSLDNFATVSASTNGVGDARNIFIDVDESISLFNSGNIRSTVEQRGRGNAGNINIEASSLTLRGGSQILSSVFRSGFNSPGGVGTGGNITITTTDFVDIAGVGTVQLDTPDISEDPDNTTGLVPTEGFSSALIANSEKGASGNAGNITVNTDVFRIADGAVVDTLTANEGNGGNITIESNTFDATGGGQLLTTARDRGNAGSINLNIADSISISGSDPNFESRLARAEEFGPTQGGGNIVNNQGSESGIFANTEQNSTGDGGNIKIGILKQEGDALVLDNTQFTKDITISNGARIAADSKGEGNGGAIFIRAKDLTLDNQAEILAETSTSQEGENTIPSEITLEIEDIVRLSNESLISAQADNNARGGNVNIDTNFIVAVPNQNNDILANAAEGTGGEINITAESVFGIEERELNDLTNDINARSDVLGLDGTVNLNTSDINPIQGATELPSNVVEARQTSEQTCSVDRQTGTTNGLTVKGRGGVQPSPDLPLTSQTIVDNGKNVAIESNEAQVQAIAPVHTSQGDIIPAQGVVVTEDGRIILTAYPTDGNSRLPQGAANCTR